MPPRNCPGCGISTEAWAEASPSFLAAQRCEHSWHANQHSDLEATPPVGEAEGVAHQENPAADDLVEQVARAMYEAAGNDRSAPWSTVEDDERGYWHRFARDIIPIAQAPLVVLVEELRAERGRLKDSCLQWNGRYDLLRVDRDRLRAELECANANLAANAEMGATLLEEIERRSNAEAARDRLQTELDEAKAQIQRLHDHWDAARATVRRRGADRDRLQAALRTLRDYIALPEGNGPIRHTEALALCDELLAPTDARTGGRWTETVTKYRLGERAESSPTGSPEHKPVVVELSTDQATEWIAEWIAETFPDANYPKVYAKSLWATLAGLPAETFEDEAGPDYEEAISGSSSDVVAGKIDKGAGE